MKIAYKKILLVIIIVLASFLFTSKVLAQTSCQRTSGEIIISLKIAYYQSRLPGGDADLRAKVPKYNQNIENYWSKLATSACNLPVRVKVDHRIVTGYKTNKDISMDGVIDETDEVFNNGDFGRDCLAKNPGYHCIHIISKNRGNSQGAIAEVDLFANYNSNYGWWFYDADLVKVDVHESGHLMGVDDEYWWIRGVLGQNDNAMGFNIARVVKQKHIDTIVGSYCQGGSFICYDNVSDSQRESLTRCCRTWRYRDFQFAITKFPETDTPTCQKDQINMCPIVRCGTSMCGVSDCKCTDEPPPPPLSSDEEGETKHLTGSATGPLVYKGVSCIKTGKCGPCDLLQILVNVNKFILGTIGGVALLFFILAGFIWLVSSGNKDKIAKGKQIYINVIIGLMIVLFAYVIISGIVMFFAPGFDFTSICP